MSLYLRNKQNKARLFEAWQNYNQALSKANSPKSTQADFDKLAKAKREWTKADREILKTKEN